MTGRRSGCCGKATWKRSARRFSAQPALSWREAELRSSHDTSGRTDLPARRPDPWQPPDWAWAAPDETFGNRFDDPEGSYRVLYASSQRLGCFLETLARFRIDLELYSELKEIKGADDYFPLGQVPVAWARQRVIGSASHHGQYADIYGSEWIGRLRRELAGDCLRFGIHDFDMSVLQGTAPRSLSQRASRIAYEAGYDGVHYRSKYGHEIRNWALFEPFKLEPQSTAEIDLADPDFVRALSIHGLQVFVAVRVDKEVQ